MLKEDNLQRLGKKGDKSEVGRRGEKRKRTGRKVRAGAKVKEKDNEWEKKGGSSRKQSGRKRNATEILLRRKLKTRDQQPRQLNGEPGG